MATEELIVMNNKEIFRLKIMEKLDDGLLSQSKASKMLGISCRQTRRILKNYRQQGIKSLVSKKRGKPSNNKIGEELIAVL